MTQRPFEELNLWQRIFMEHWTGFAASYEREHGRAIPEHWQENVERMLSCGDIREGYYEYQCQDCHTTKKVGFHLQESAVSALLQDGGGRVVESGEESSL